MPSVCRLPACPPPDCLPPPPAAPCSARFPQPRRWPPGACPLPSRGRRADVGRARVRPSSRTADDLLLPNPRLVAGILRRPRLVGAMADGAGGKGLSGDGRLPDIHRVKRMPDGRPLMRRKTACKMGGRCCRTDRRSTVGCP